MNRIIAPLLGIAVVLVALASCPAQIAWPQPLPTPAAAGLKPLAHRRF